MLMMHSVSFLGCTMTESPTIRDGGVMARDHPVRLLRSDFTLGGEQAEADPLLQSAFYESDHYMAIERRDDTRCFLIGRTGSGKSAALQYLETVNAEHVIRINPQDLSLPYITELGAIRYLTSIDVHLDPLFIALWKHVLLVEVLKHRYKINSLEEKQTFMASLTARLRRDASKKAALEYLDEFGGKFWCEADERVKDITERFEREVDSEAKASFGLPHVGSLDAGVGSTASVSTEVRAEQASRFQRIVNATQLPRLNQMIKVLDEDILDSDQLFTYVIIDDLDQDWVDEQIANTLIRCLFRTILELKRVQRLKILVALRTNIFEELNFGGRTGGQEEKVRSLTLRMRWTQAQLTSVLDERARVAADKYSLPRVQGIRDLLPASNKTKGDPLRFILDRTLMRPRDALAFLNECFVLASGKSRITWTEILGAENPYSYKRLLALRDEWKPTYPDIDKLFTIFRFAPVPMNREEFTSRLDDAALLPADPKFSGILWMSELAQPIWEGVVGDWAELYHPLIRLLFNLGFIGISSNPKAPKYFYDDPDFAERLSNLQSAEYFHIHPAFRVALDSIPVGLL